MSGSPGKAAASAFEETECALTEEPSTPSIPTGDVAWRSAVPGEVQWWAGNVKDESEAVLRDHESTLDIPIRRWRLA